VSGTSQQPPVNVGNLRNQANRESRQRDDLIAERTILQGEIERLQAAERAMRGYKQTVDDLRREVRSHDSGAVWLGQLRTRHCDHIDSSFRTRYDNYHTETDNLHDSIIFKIAELQNEVRGQTTIIDRLFNSINTLWSRIRAATN